MSSHDDQELAYRINGWLGTGMLAAASFTLLAIFADKTGMSFVAMPAIWKQMGSLQILVCVMLFAFAFVLLMPVSAARQAQSDPVVTAVCIYTKPECPLCDEAIQVLRQESDRLPPFDLVDISDDPELMRQFGESVPVIEIDGKIRFRGAVHPILLQRLLDGLELQAVASREKQASGHENEAMGSENSANQVPDSSD
ncbi:MAG: glutaredoxin family protein [Planctomyces sp.]|nr:glutaredoxin family protein [Planctomyces sp.]